MRNLHIKMSHVSNKPALLDNSEQTLSEGFDCPIKALDLWAREIYKIYVEKFGTDKLSLDDIKNDCLKIIRKEYDKSIRDFEVDIKNSKLGSVVELDIGRAFNIFIHANKSTLKEFI